MENLFFDLPENLQNKIMQMKKEIEESEEKQKFYDYIEGRKVHNKKMDEMNSKYKNVRMPFGKYKGSSIYSIAEFKDRYFMPVGKSYLKWVSENVEIKDPLLKEVIEFYKDYHYNYRDGCD